MLNQKKNTFISFSQTARHKQLSARVGDNDSLSMTAVSLMKLHNLHCVRPFVSYSFHLITHHASPSLALPFFLIFNFNFISHFISFHFRCSSPPAPTALRRSSRTFIFNLNFSIYLRRLINI